MTDSHHHDHDHAPIESEPALGRYQLLTTAVKELMVEKGRITAEEMRVAIEKMDARSPAAGAQVIARAWTDPAFKERLLDDAPRAVAELGVDMGPTHLMAVENTDAVHNVIVCTLCSCYPRNLLGLPPDWYKSRSYRSRVVYEPRTVLAEFGTEIDDDVEVRVHDSTADLRYVVVPRRPTGTDGMGEDSLAAMITRDTMIGVALPRPPAA